MNAPLLQMSRIRKQYPGVLALDDVDFTLQAGEIHCLLGENGAGKTTLMKILAGALSKDAGEIRIEGVVADLRSPADAQALGIGMIYQDFKQVPELTVAENILLGHEPRKGGAFIDVAALRKEAEDILLQLGEEIDTQAAVGSLSVAKRQIVEIAKALSRKIRILAMDEPSAALTDSELQNLFRVIRRLKAEGAGIIYISHRMEEIFEVGDRITVLRDGKFIHSCAVGEVDRPGLIRLMVGRALEEEYPKTVLERGRELLTLEGISGGIVNNVSLTLYQGEILGLAGLVGAGRTELARIIFGADPKEDGRVTLEGKEINPRSPREAIDLGIGLLTEDRNAYGLITQMGVQENITLANVREILSGGFISASKEAAAAHRFVDELRIKTPSIEQEVENLSGGNRQKVVLARWLFTNSKVLIFDEPTSGIDVGVKYEIYMLMGKLAREGIGVLVISSELPELLGVCDRIAVMCEGRLTGILEREHATQERIMSMATSYIEGLGVG